MVLLLTDVHDSKLELHYYLSDESHSIDAFVRHKCETEVLTLIKDLASALGNDFEVLAEIPTEGGWRDWWKVIKKNGQQIALAGFLLQLVNTVLTRNPPTDTELRNLQLRNLQMDTLIKHDQLEELRKRIEMGKDTTKLVNEIVDSISTNYKVIKHKSNFYQALQSYGNVTKITTTTYLDDKVKKQTNEVDRADFNKFILKTNELAPLEIEDAVIEVISPVLNNDKYRWRGVYEGEVINFWMNDKDYKFSVLSGKTSFHSGLYLQCNLKIKRAINDVGIIEHKDYFVSLVSAKIEDNKVIQTEQGKRYKRNKEDLGRQGDLFKED